MTEALLSLALSLSLFTAGCATTSALTSPRTLERQGVGIGGKWVCVVDTETGACVDTETGAMYLLTRCDAMK